MNITKRSDLVETLLRAVGGTTNISYVQHCATRLRFSLKDRGAVNREAIDGSEGVLGSQWSNGELQVIIGPSVGDVYRALCSSAGLERQDPVNETLVGDVPSRQKTRLKVGDIITFITSCVVPVLPIIFGASFVKIIVLLMDMLNVGVGSGTYQVLTMAGDAGFYFLPIFIGANTAKVCGASQALGMLMGAILVHPTLISASAGGTTLDVYGIPVTLVNYSSSFLPALIGVWIMSYVQKFVGKHSPSSLRTILEPLLTILVMLPVLLCIVGPLGSILGQYLGDAVIWLYGTLGFVGVALMAALCPLIVSSGMHLALLAYAITQFTAQGHESLVFVTGIIATFALGAAALGVFIKSKSASIKATSLGAFVAAVAGGVSEPSLFGVALAFKTPLYATMIGGALGGAVAGIGHASAYSITSSSIWNLVAFLPGGVENFLWELAGVVIAFIATLALTLVLYKDAEDANSTTSVEPREER